MATLAQHGDLPSTDYRPRMAEGLHEDKLGELLLLFNPEVAGSVVLLNPTAQRLLQLADGTRTVRQVSLELREPVADVVQAVGMLTASGALEGHGRRGSHKKPSLSCWIHMTNACNLACPYCYIQKSVDHMPRELAEALVSRLLEECRSNAIPALHLTFAGGEPLLRLDELKGLVAHSQANRGDIDVQFKLVTNATLIKPEVAEYLAENGFRTGVSVDGHQATHDGSRHYRSETGSFDDVISGISHLRRAGVPVNLLHTITGDNFLELPRTTELLLDLNCPFRFSLERNILKGVTSLNSHEAELIEVLHAAYDVVEKRLPSANILTNHLFCDAHLDRPLRRSCSAGNSYLAMRHDGALSVCGQSLSRPWGEFDSVTGSLVSALRHANADLLARDPGSTSCERCTWRFSCAGGCPLHAAAASGGDYNSRSPYCRVYGNVLPRIVRIRGLQIVKSRRST